jgi:hypothetical protein
MGRAARLRRKTEDYLREARESGLPGILGYAYANAVTAGRLWNAFHTDMLGHEVWPCAPFGVAVPEARYCAKPAVCPCCAARQAAQLVETLQHNSTQTLVAARTVVSSMDRQGVLQMCTASRKLLERSGAKTRALLLRVYPRSDEDAPVIGAVLVAGDGNPDVFLDGALNLAPQTFTADTKGLRAFVAEYAAYPAGLLSLNPADVCRAYALLRGFRSSISRKKVYAKHSYYQWDGDSNRFAFSFPDLETPPGSPGGFLPQLQGWSTTLHQEPVIVTTGGRYSGQHDSEFG